MIKETITPQNVVDLLNELLKIDYACVWSLTRNRVICNEELKKHPTIRIHHYKGEEFPSVGLIGILNGLFGVDEEGYGCIGYNMDGGKIVRFGLINELSEKKELKK